MSRLLKMTNAEIAAELNSRSMPIGNYHNPDFVLLREAAARITELEAENTRLRNRAQAEGFWLGKTTEKEPDDAAR